MSVCLWGGGGGGGINKFCFLNNLENNWKKKEKRAVFGMWK